jgi:beta-xylosidase
MSDVGSTTVPGARAARALAGLALLLGLAAPAALSAQQQPAVSTVRLADVQMRDASVLADATSRTYYIVASARGAAVRAYTSKDLVDWQGPHTIFQTPPGLWGSDVNIRGIWAPELHAYGGKYYLFLTFDSDKQLPEQWTSWINWLPRVRRGSQVLVGDSPLGPFRPFAGEPTLPQSMMTLDGTLWVEDGVPYMVFAHEWVQITIGTVEYVQLKDDLSEAVAEPKRLFDAQDAPWALKQREGCYVTDAPYLRKSKSGKLFMIWSSFSKSGYTTGVAVSDSGKLVGPWVQRPEPVYSDDGGHAMLFETFDGKLMMVLHSPNGPAARPRIFQLEDTGETLRVAREFTAAP